MEPKATLELETTGSQVTVVSESASKITNQQTTVVAVTTSPLETESESVASDNQANVTGNVKTETLADMAVTDGAKQSTGQKEGNSPEGGNKVDDGQFLT